eukprot:TRINITY_DN11967_c0_g1_i4.p1 TRINITY_DN11967_c0_g1~~TRINITY_DN11967_c0_g1_i4.p1  ORF type:complete len:156 (-),score=38.50 TRINITY_DN11967_c0_g1_i4:56-523(-)
MVLQCCRKYDDIMFKMFVKVFKRMPLCSVIAEHSGQGIYIVHGGMTSDPDMRLADIDCINRKKYASTLTRRKGHTQSKPDLMLEEMVWSDPWDKPGITPSDRGSGVLFGPDVVVNFLELNNLKTLCLLYTSDAADEEDSVDLGGRRIIKKKKRRK